MIFYEHPGNVTPHKCPACDGWGKRTIFDPVTTTGTREESCVPCRGTGVLWTPAHEVVAPPPAKHWSGCQCSICCVLGTTQLMATAGVVVGPW